MNRIIRILSLLIALQAICLASAEKVTKETIESQGKKRTYYLFIPSTAKPGGPLLITLHGANRNGVSLVDKWKEIAIKEGMIVAGPDASDSKVWAIPHDGPNLLRDLVESLKTKYQINPRKVYLFGHSAGAIFALNMAMVESEYFAAVALHAGVWTNARELVYTGYAKRKTPLSIFIGDRDEIFAMREVKMTNDALKEKGFDVDVTILKGHNHWYYDLAPKINVMVWDFFKKHELPHDPKFEEYDFQKQIGMAIDQIRSELYALANKEKAAHHQRFFKTGPGEYGEGDVFLGVTVPEIRKVAAKFKDASIDDCLTLLRSTYHEERLLALIMLVRLFSKGDPIVRKKIYDLYLDNTAHINNWDLVDVSAPNIAGGHLIDKSRKPLYRLAKSKSLWERRISIMATFYFIRDEDFDDALAISKLLLNDREDLIHKAVGWMLREVGNRNRLVEQAFLDQHYTKMPRTMLRYAIEKFPEAKRKRYLKLIIDN